MVVPPPSSFLSGPDGQIEGPLEKGPFPQNFFRQSCRCSCAHSCPILRRNLAIWQRPWAGHQTKHPSCGFAMQRVLKSDGRTLAADTMAREGSVVQVHGKSPRCGLTCGRNVAHCDCARMAPGSRGAPRGVAQRKA